MKALDHLVQDVKYACRVLWRNPGFAAGTILTIALGIGATTAVFTVVDETLFRSVPYPHPDRLVSVIGVVRPGGGGGPDLTPLAIANWRAQKLFDRLEAYGCQPFDLSDENDSERVTACTVSTGLFPMLGVAPDRGRAFLDEDGRPGADRVAIIGADLSRRRFGSAQEAIGKRIVLNDAPYQVVAVMPRRFQLRNESVWLPLDVGAASAATNNLEGIAWLPPGVDRAAVEQRANAFAPAVQKASGVSASFPYVRLLSMVVAYVSESVRRAMFVLLGAVAFVLLIASANIANLLLARATSRQREVAVRSALGASRSRLVRQALTESLVISLAGGLVGVALAAWAVDLVVAILPASTLSFVAGTIEVDGRIVMFASAITMGSGILFGLVPAIRGSRPNLELPLRGGASSVARTFGRVPGLLVVVEVALALMLLAGAALMTRTFAKLHSIDPGFDPHDVVALDVSAPLASYPTPAARASFAGDIVRSVSQVPRVRAVSLASGLPGDSGFSEGTPEAEGSAASSSHMYIGRTLVDRVYFQALRIPILMGRTFDDTDPADAIVVNKSLADMFWPDGSAVGRRFRPYGTDRWYTIVGVAGDVEGRPIDDDFPVRMQMYDRVGFQLPAIAQASRPIEPGAPRRYYTRPLVLRADNAAAIVPDVKARIHTVDRSAVVDRVRLADDVYADFFAPQRFALVLMTVFSGIALVLAAAGIFAVLAQAVAQRTREIGIRVALGAEPSDVFRLVMSKGLVLTAIGVVAGGGGALAVSRVLRSLLYEVSPYDAAVSSPSRFFSSSWHMRPAGFRHDAPCASRLPPRCASTSGRSSTVRTA